MTIAGKRKADPVLSVRRVFVWSSARAGAAATARARKLDRATRRPGAAHPRAGRPPLPRPPTRSQARLAAIATAPPGQRPAARRGRHRPASGKPTLSWHFDQAALAAEAATDGWYGLLTNLDPAQVDAAEVLARYKGQEVVERRYGAFKGPLAVAPLFVQSNRRIQALVTVICLALLIFCLVERPGPPRHRPRRHPPGPVRRPARPSPPGG